MTPTEGLGEERWKIRRCRVCGRTNRVNPLRGRHYSGGKLCDGEIETFEVGRVDELSAENEELKGMVRTAHAHSVYAPRRECSCWVCDPSTKRTDQPATADTVSHPTEETERTRGQRNLGAHGVARDDPETSTLRSDIPEGADRGTASAEGPGGESGVPAAPQDTVDEDWPDEGLDRWDVEPVPSELSAENERLRGALEELIGEARVLELAVEQEFGLSTDPGYGEEGPVIRKARAALHPAEETVATPVADSPEDEA